ncbi:MAG TPA: alpha/beta fold hydrolase [Gemmatimonadaceae bacterium]|nr:alpha/beta fold hydrolase [Gemmatimonadaceae bacterium]
MPTAADDALIYSFGEYELDTRLHELRRAGNRLHVEPQVFAVLAHLFAARDRVVQKEELLDTVWGHRYVAPTTLNSRIKAARRAVGDDGTAQRVIRTVHGRGFRVVAQVTEQDTAQPSPERPPGQSIHFCTSDDGVRIAYATSGSGPPLVKPAHWLTHVEYDWESPVWRHWLRELSRDHTLIRYDQRGSGLSDQNADDISFDAFVRDLETVVDATGLERFPLLGLSQGCAVAIAYAVRHPERVSRLVLYGGFAQGRRARARTPEEREESELLTRQIPLGWGRDNPAFRMFFAARFLPEGTPEQTSWFSELQRVSTSPEGAVRLFRASSVIDVVDMARRVTAPTLVLHATRDAQVPFDQGRLIASLIPGARFVPLDGQNHVLLEHEPAWRRFLDEVRRFLAEDDSEAFSSAPQAAPRRSKRR